jgi:uncharacterized protein YndB with AHSA1/START domain
MTRIVTIRVIRRPIDEVFAYVTTPGNWPRWHPSSLGVSGATDHSLVMGEQVTEEYRVAGRRGRALWTVIEREAPRRWVIRGQVAGGNGGTVSYTLTPHTEGTRFVREFVYTFAQPWLRLLDPLLVRPRVAAESAEALRRLQRVLEEPSA